MRFSKLGLVVSFILLYVYMCTISSAVLLDKGSPLRQLDYRAGDNTRHAAGTSAAAAVGTDETTSSASDDSSGQSQILDQLLRSEFREDNSKTHVKLYPCLGTC